MSLNPRFQFDAFVVGAGNRLAVDAARAVAEATGTTYNPLFLYGPTGLGKTHLLQAIGHQALRQQPAARVQYVTLEVFTDQFHAAVAAGQSDAFRASAEEADVFLLDDVQFLADLPEMHAVLLRLSEALPAAHRQLVLASDCPPGEIRDLDARLIARLSGGLLVDVAPPEFETRLAILRRKTEERGAALAPEVLAAVAEIGSANVRELLGLVNRLIAYQAVNEAPLSPEGARALLAGEGPEGPGSAAAAPRAEPGAPAERPRPSRASDDFSSFLNVVSQSLARQIEAWRGRISEAVVRWQGQGYRTARLEALLEQDAVPDVAAVIARFEADVAALRALVETVETFDSAAAGSSRFKDPDRLEEARAWVARAREGATPPPAPSGALTFETLIVGAANAAAVAAAREAIADPGHGHSPLVFVGPVGTGKTHLLHAVGNALVALRPDAVIACLSAQTLFEELIAALHGERADWWRRRYRGADALLLDDVQLLARKERTQEELLALLGAYREAGKQLVLTAELPPSQLEGIAPQLAACFGAGVVVELQHPDREMRTELARRLLAAQNVGADQGVAEYIGSRPVEGARAVAGLVHRVVATIDASHETLTVLQARLAAEGETGRVSAVLAAASTAPEGLDQPLRSREKVVWEWPDVGDRLIEELR